MNRRISDKKSRKERALITAVSMFLLTKEELKNQFWTVKSVSWKHETGQMKVGVSSINGKLGTTLAKLRKVAKALGEHLFQTEMAYITPRIVFFVDKKDEEIEKMYNLLDNIEPKK